MKTIVEDYEIYIWLTLYADYLASMFYFLKLQVVCTVYFFCCMNLKYSVPSQISNEMERRRKKKKKNQKPNQFIR